MPAVAPTRLLLALSAARAAPMWCRRSRRHARLFVAGQRIEHGDLATPSGVGRSTLHRWVGSRDDLLAEIVWSLIPGRFRRELEQSDAAAARVVRRPGGRPRPTPTHRFRPDLIQTANRTGDAICTTKASPRAAAQVR